MGPIKSIFKKYPAIIGMVHFSPLDGYDDCPGREIVLERARVDLKKMIDGGVDAVMFENNFDDPKFEKMPARAAQHFIVLVEELTKGMPVPWGLSPLWNDFSLGLALCHRLGGVMVRVPVFIDSVETKYGIFEAMAKEVISERRKLDALDVLILADVHVKHARMVNPRAFDESVRETIKCGADAIIITGAWTGDPPSIEQCRLAKEISGGKVMVITGSGLTQDNVLDYLPYIDACIVGTAFKEGDVDTQKRTGPNIVGAERRYDERKIKSFVGIVNDYRSG